MPIIEFRDNENNRWKRKAKHKDKKKKMFGASYSESVRAKWFCCSFKLGFAQLLCNSSLIFKSNLELALSNNLKESELYKSKDVVVECRYLKTCDLLSFLICSSILVLKLLKVSPMQLELQPAQVNLHTRKDFKSSGIGSVYGK